MYSYQFTGKSFKQLQKLSTPIQKRILKKLDFYCQSNPLTYAEKITDCRLGDYRFRIGDWRVVFDLEEDDRMLTILLVGHRRDIYRP